MKVITENLSVSTKGDCDIINITDNVQSIISKSKLQTGNAAVFVVGSTASISTIEYEPGLQKDLSAVLDKLIPRDYDYKHHDTWGDYNGHAHIRSAIVGCSTTIPFDKGDLMLGTWQQLVLIDFDDRPRTRRVVVQLIGE
jgi:secondary thiamine-phosphate synthase enzyme